MKLIRPVTITDAMLVSSSIAEPDSGETAWNSSTTYALDDEIYLASTHRVYRSKQAANLNKNPVTETAWWLDIGGTNKWAMFDEYVSTASTDTTPLTAVFDPGIIDALALFNLTGNTATITMTDGAGGPTVYTRELQLQVPVMGDWYAYYFEPFRQIPVFVLTDLPPYLNARVTVAVEGDTTASVGMCIPGRSYTIGDSQYGVEVGIRDYSRKTTDEDTGFIALEQRHFAKTMQATVRLASQYFPEVHQQLEQLRATPCVWIADKTGQSTPMTMFGFYRDFRLVVDYPGLGAYSLDIEGMI